MNKISKAVEAAINDLDASGKSRVLTWFINWTNAQLSDTAKET